MYVELALLAAFILIYNLFAKRIEKTIISGPVLYLIFGILIGPLFFGVFKVEINDESYLVLAELALALVLFTDASKANMKVLKKIVQLPIHLLLIGLPITIGIGYVIGTVVFDGFEWLELAILATILAPTDAALGKAVATNLNVPEKIRETLNVESGLNDGICVPVLLLLMALFSNISGEQVNLKYSITLFAQQIGLGVLVGVVVTFLSVKLLDYCISKNWIIGSKKSIIIIALTFTCFAISQFIGGSGFIACFTGGLLFGTLTLNKEDELIEAAEGIGDTLSLITWVIFGAVVVSNFMSAFTLKTLLYAVLSLTIVRMLPVFLVLKNTNLKMKEKLFIGWFGPRGLASIVFVIMILDLNLPHEKTIVVTIILTILLSILLHGITANPFISLLFKPKKVK